MPLPMFSCIQGSCLLYEGISAAAQFPREVWDVNDAIDVYCHCDQGHQDGLAVAKHATRNGIGGILYKSIAGKKGGAATVNELKEDLNCWADEEKLEPIDCCAGYEMRGEQTPTLKNTKKQIAAGAIAFWIPVAQHATTLIFAMSEEIEKVGFQHGVVDHPFSAFLDLSIEQQKKLGRRGHLHEPHV